MKNKDGLFFDYNFKDNRLSDIFSVASFYPMFTKMLSEEQAKTIMDNLPRLETEYGILACEKGDVFGIYQWNLSERLGMTSLYCGICK